GAIRLGVVHDSFASASSGPIEAKDGEVVDGVLILLSRGGALDGHALREGEPGPPGTRIRVSLFGGPLEAWSQSRDSVIDESGYFKVEGLPPGRYSVVATVPPRPDERMDGESFRRRSHHAVAVVEDGRTTRVVFPDHPEGPCTLRGRVLRGEEGVEGATVRVVPTQPPGNPDPFRMPLSGRTSAGGTFKIEHVPPGWATLRVQASPTGGADGFAPKSLSIEIPDRPDHEIDVQLSDATISGRVVRAADGAPVSGVRVEALPATLHLTQDLALTPVAGVLTDEEGRYRVSDLEPGRYVVRAGRRWGRGEAEDEAPLALEARGPIEVAEGGETIADFALARGGTAIVRVSDPGGSPVKEAGVLLVPAVVPTGLHLLYAGGVG
ncbi:MAG TPA: carboxypeptidase regulatory-like domain-containing protein, partial [Planctomycetota bacterium]|nr:carboxypeptidase regulatory-like domain-containing protein [Planctomycetota bacterium]